MIIVSMKTIGLETEEFWSILSGLTAADTPTVSQISFQTFSFTCTFFLLLVEEVRTFNWDADDDCLITIHKTAHYNDFSGHRNHLRRYFVSLLGSEFD